MANGKKAFMLYADQRVIIDYLSDEDAGKLLKHIFKYVNDEDPPEDNSPLVNLAFAPIKLQLKRDLKKWESALNQRSEAGKESARRRQQSKELEQRNSTTVESRSTNSTVKVKVKDKVKDKVKEIKIYRQFAHLKLTQDEFNSLAKKYSVESIDSIMDEIENYKGNKKYTSLNLTIQNWLKKRFPMANNGSDNSIFQSPN